MNRHKAKLCVFLFVIMSFNVVAQDSILRDSLMLLLKTNMADTSKVYTYLQLANITAQQDSSVSLGYFNKAEKLSKQINFTKGLAKTYLEATVLCNKNPKKAIEYIQLAKQLYLKLADYRAVGNCYLFQSDKLVALYKYTEFENCVDSAIIYFKKVDDKLKITEAHIHLGSILYVIGDYNRSLYFNELGMKEALECGHPRMVAYALDNFGNIHYDLGNYRTSLKYHFNSLKIKTEIGFQLGLLYSNQHIADVYEKMQMYDSAIWHHKRALEVSDKVEYFKEFRVAETLIKMGFVYELKSDTKHAINCYMRALRLMKSVGFERIECMLYKNLGVHYKKQKQYGFAILYFQKGLEIAQKVKSPLVAIDAAKELSKIYDELRDSKNGYKYYVLYRNISDSLNQSDNLKKMSLREMQLDYAQKEKIKALEEQKKEAIQKAEIKRRNILIAFFTTGFGLMLLLAFVLYRSYRSKQQANILLAQQKEEIVVQNEELIQQREEIITQRDEIEQKNALLTENNRVIEGKNKAITSSILYAQRIQSVILTPEDDIQFLLPEFFILFKPCQIVSGDFYWIKHVTSSESDLLFIVAVDCTGHGVPGAFMSMLGVAFLNEVIIHNGVTQPAVILEELRRLIKQSLRQTGDYPDQKDGMDIALCAIDLAKNEMQYAGAYNSLYIMRDKALVIIAADRMPIGVYAKEQAFTNHQIQLYPNDMFYIFSDGYASQYGSAKREKFKYSKFRALISEIHTLPAMEQKTIMDATIENWRGDLNQTDDILVIGFKISTLAQNT